MSLPRRRSEHRIKAAGFQYDPRRWTLTEREQAKAAELTALGCSG